MRESVGGQEGDMASIKPVLLLGKAKAIAAAADHHVCAIVTARVPKENRNVDLMQCWGSNSNGGLGNGDTNDRGLIDVGDKYPIPPALIFKTPIKKTL